MVKSFTTLIKAFCVCAFLFSAAGAKAQTIELYDSNGYPVNFVVFATTVINSASNGEAFYVNASGLTANLQITAPAEFEVSSTSSTSGFGSSISFTQAAGEVSYEEFWIRFKPASVGTFSYNVVASSNGAVSEEITVEGTSIYPQVYTWNVSSGNWSEPLSWDPARTSPQESDILEINNFISSPIIYLDGTGTSNIGQLRIINGVEATIEVATNNRVIAVGANIPNPDFFIDNTSSLKVTSPTGLANKATILIKSGNTAEINSLLSLDGAGHQLLGANAGAIRFKSGGEMRPETTYPGSAYPFGSGTSGNGTSGSVIFEMGSVFTQYNGNAPFGSNPITPSPVTIFLPGSYYFLESTTVTSLASRTYGNLTVSGAGILEIAGANNFNVQNLTINSGTLDVKTHTIVSGNIFVNTSAAFIGAAASTRTFNFTGSQQTISGGGNFSFNVFSVSVPSTTTVILENDITVDNSIEVAGTLDAGSSIITGGAGSSFTLNSTGRFLSDLTDAFSNTGNVRTDIVNYGIADYEFYGTAASSGANFPSTVKSLTLNTTGDFTISSPVTVQESLTMPNGKLNTTAGTLSVLNTTTITGVTETRFINGPLDMTSATASMYNFTFPIGKGNDFRPVSLTLNHETDAQTTYRAELMNGAPTARTVDTVATELIADSIATNRYFSVSKLSGADLSSASITLTVAGDYGPINANSTGHRRRATIAKSEGGDWVDLGEGSGAIYDATAKTLTSAVYFTTFSDFVYGVGRYDAVPLPVTLVSLTAEPAVDKVQVLWTTGSEKDNDYFDVERSTDGKNFTAVGRVSSLGYSNFRVNYTFTDNEPANGVAYYRLRQVDFDGAVSYFGPVAARLGGATPAVLNVYPNPATSELNLSLGMEATEKAQIRIMSLVGTTVLEKNVSGDAIQNTIQLPVGQLRAGTYIIEITNSAGTTARRFVKQ